MQQRHCSGDSPWEFDDGRYDTITSNFVMNIDDVGLAGEERKFGR